jgi:RND family efflux transporter MFP subunit
VEKLYVDATGQHVHRGDPLFEIYSPELYSAQTEYLLALDSATSGSAVLKETARRKLKYMDISDEQVSELEKTREPRKTLRIGAPIDGYVMNKMAVEGQMVEPGMTLYRLANHDTIWVQGEIYEQDVPLVRLGQEASVTVNAWPDLKFRGRVTFILPEFDEKTRTVKVRMEFHNPGHILRPGMFATARIVADVGQSAVLVPDSAVLRSGEKNTVFVALDEGRFEPRTVVLGRAGEDNHYEVVSGLSAGERVVASGQFMLDSESQLREAIQKMMGTAEGPSVETSARASGSASSAVNIPDAQHSTIYICPMPEHVAIEHMQPGKCSLCGMGLVPVSPEMLERIQPGGKIDGYTCPMPEHSDVREAKPGKCARCGMTLVPIMSLPELPDEAPQLYTCPMASHAHVVSDKPGKCPECEMDLVPTNGVRHGKTAEENWRKQHPAQP